MNTAGALVKPKGMTWKFIVTVSSPDAVSGCRHLKLSMVVTLDLRNDLLNKYRTLELSKWSFDPWDVGNGYFSVRSRLHQGEELVSYEAFVVLHTSYQIDSKNIHIVAVGGIPDKSLRTARLSPYNVTDADITKYKITFS
ncbi:hypothetical protein Tco_0184342 [Tanacetum coccineum]